MIEPLDNYAETIVREARKPQVVEVDDLAVLALPEGYHVEDVEKLHPTPHRARGTTELHDVDSFVAYCKDHLVDDGLGKQRIYCDADYGSGKVRFVAVLNDHQTARLPEWRDFRAGLGLRNSPEWIAWKGRDRQPFDQAGFAGFIEDRIGDIATTEGSPTGSQMLELALNFEASQDARFRSALRLQSGGVDLVYVEQEDDSTLRKMQAFERFAIGIPPFLNGAPYLIQARLRYRIKEGRLALWYELIRPDVVLQDAVKGVIAKVATSTDLLVLMGTP